MCKKKAAEQGYAEALYNLGIMYEKGEGVEKGKLKAIDFYRKAANNGNENAKQALKELSLFWKIFFIISAFYSGDLFKANY